MEWLLVPDGLVWVFQKLLIDWDFHTQPSLGFTENGPEKEKIEKCLVDVRGQRRMGRLVRDDRKATVTQITTRYNQGMQNTISERTTHRTLKQMGYSRRRPHREPLLSAKNRKRSLQFAQAQLNWTIADWKKLPGLMSLDFCCVIQMVESEFDIKNLKTWIYSALSQRFRLVVVVWWGIFSWHTLGLLVPIEHRLNATDYLSIVADHVHPFMTTVYPSSDATSSRIVHHVTNLN